MSQTPASSVRSLQEKINHLFQVVRPPGQKREYTLPEVHKALAELNFQTSTSYLSSLRTGQRDNPSKAVLEGLAKFFGVSPLYFFDDEQAAVIEQELELLAAMRDGDIRAIALRAHQLNDTDRELLRRIAETMGEPVDPTSAPTQAGGAQASDDVAVRASNGAGRVPPAAARRRPGTRAATSGTTGRPSRS